MSDTGSTIDKNVGEIKSIEGERGDEAMSVDGTTIITKDGDSGSEEEDPQPPPMLAAFSLQRC